MNQVSRDEVAKYYITCELENILHVDKVDLKEGEYHVNTARLLEALSFTYRANSVFDFVQNEQYAWYKMRVAVADITLTGLGEHLSPYVYSEEINQDPIRFAALIARELEPPTNDLFEQLRPRPIPENRRTIMLREEEGKLKMLDGSHRFMSMVMDGCLEVPAYVARFVNPQAKPMIGEAIFHRLRRQWQQTDDADFRHNIEGTVFGMMGTSVDGVDAVRAYWVVMAPNEAVRQKGEELLRVFHNQTEDEA